MRLPTDPPQHPATSHIPEGQPAPPEELVSTLLPVSHTPQSTLTADSDDIHPPQYTPREDGVGSPEDPNEFPKDKKEDAGPPQIITPMIDRTDDSLTRISPGGEIHNPMDDANFYPFEPMFMPPNPGTGLPDYTDVSQHSPASHNTRPAAGQETASGSTTGAQGLPPPAFDDKGGTDLGEFNVSLSDDAGAKMQGDGWDAGAKVLGRYSCVVKYH